MSLVTNFIASSVHLHLITKSRQLQTIVDPPEWQNMAGKMVLVPNDINATWKAMEEVRNVVFFKDYYTPFQLCGVINILCNSLSLTNRQNILDCPILTVSTFDKFSLLLGFVRPACKLNVTLTCLNRSSSDLLVRQVSELARSHVLVVHPI